MNLETEPDVIILLGFFGGGYALILLFIIIWQIVPLIIATAILHFLIAIGLILFGLTLKYKDEEETPKTNAENQTYMEYQSPNQKKGFDFERYVLRLLTNPIFVIEDVSSDYYDKAYGIIIESSKNPDIRIRYDPLNTVFSIECKFRSKFYWDTEKREHVIRWCDPDQLQRYREYHNLKNPVLVAIGVGANPQQPKEMYLVPLKELNSHIITKTKLNSYGRSPKGKISWYEIQKLLS